MAVLFNQFINPLYCCRGRKKDEKLVTIIEQNKEVLFLYVSELLLPRRKQQCKIDTLPQYLLRNPM